MKKRTTMAAMYRKAGTIAQSDLESARKGIRKMACSSVWANDAFERDAARNPRAFWGTLKRRCGGEKQVKGRGCHRYVPPQDLAPNRPWERISPNGRIVTYASAPGSTNCKCKMCERRRRIAKATKPLIYELCSDCRQRAIVPRSPQPQPNDHRQMVKMVTHDTNWEITAPVLPENVRGHAEVNINGKPEAGTILTSEGVAMRGTKVEQCRIATESTDGLIAEIHRHNMSGFVQTTSPHKKHGRQILRYYDTKPQI